jgi:hypothetical protein
VANLFSRLEIGGKLQAIGFESHEQAGLFADMENPTRSHARIPAFLANIANPARPDTRDWDLSKARRDWYWGYLWSGTGLTPKSVFEDWMWWCSELLLYKVEDPSAKQGKWIPVTRAGLENTITEAMNWFDRDEDGYRATVQTLERVYGYDRIPALFAPLGSSPQGTETVEASDRLKEAQQFSDRLKLEEEALSGADDLSDVIQALPSLLEARSALLSRVNQVKSRHPETIRLDNLKTIRLNDKSESLFERVTRAKLFADHVEQVSERICTRTDDLIKEINTDCQELTHFPKNLFTLSLQTVRNIVEGALQQSKESETARQEGRASSDTLLHYLRSLQLDMAAERLELLLQEVGCETRSEQIRALSDIEGHIISAYRQCKKKYQDMQDHYDSTRQRIDEALRVLDPLPDDYKKPDHPSDLVKSQQNLLLIGDAFEELAEQAQTERERYSQQARKGNFNAIRDIPSRLLKPHREQIITLGGALIKIENMIASYRENRLLHANDDLPSTLNPLFTACGEMAIPNLRMDEIKTLTLHELNVRTDLREQQALKKAETLLKESSVSVERWREIAREILENRTPKLSADEQESLVSQGIIRMKYDFGE